MRKRRAGLTCPLPRSWLNNVGFLKLVLRDALGAEVAVTSLLTQIVRARPGARAHL